MTGPVQNREMGMQVGGVGDGRVSESLNRISTGLAASSSISRSPPHRALGGLASSVFPRLGRGFQQSWTQGRIKPPVCGETRATVGCSEGTRLEPEGKALFPGGTIDGTNDRQ